MSGVCYVLCRAAFISGDCYVLCRATFMSGVFYRAAFVGGVCTVLCRAAFMSGVWSVLCRAAFMSSVWSVLCRAALMSGVWSVLCRTAFRKFRPFKIINIPLSNPKMYVNNCVPISSKIKPTSINISFYYSRLIHITIYILYIYTHIQTFHKIIFYKYSECK